MLIVEAAARGGCIFKNTSTPMLLVDEYVPEKTRTLSLSLSLFLCLSYPSSFLYFQLGLSLCWRIVPNELQ